MVKVPKGVTLVVGLGISGRAICRHLERLGRPCMVADTRDAPPGLDAFREAHPNIEVHCGSLADLDMREAREVVVSPGVDPHLPELEALKGLAGESGDPMVVGRWPCSRVPVVPPSRPLPVPMQSPRSRPCWARWRPRRAGEWR